MPWSHYQEVAKRDPEQQDELLYGEHTYGPCACGRTGFQYRLSDTLVCTVCYGEAEIALVPTLKPPRFKRYVPRKDGAP